VTSSFATGSASAGLSGAVTVILVWLFSLWHVSVPGEVAGAFGAILAFLFHLVAVKWGIPSLTAVDDQTTKSNPGATS
jgi:hypothetical protein